MHDENPYAMRLAAKPSRAGKFALAMSMVLLLTGGAISLIDYFVRCDERQAAEYSAEKHASFERAREYTRTVLGETTPPLLTCDERHEPPEYTRHRCSVALSGPAPRRVVVLECSATSCLKRPGGAR